MKLLKSMYFEIIIMALVSYVLATHFALQWYTSILVSQLIIAVVIGINWLVSKLLFGIQNNTVFRVMIAALIIVIMISIPKYDGTKEYSDCAYPPFQIIEDTEIDNFFMYNGAYYVEDEKFTGIVRYTGDTVSLYDTIKDENIEFVFEETESRWPPITNAVYYDGNVYTTGEGLRSERSTPQSSYSLFKFNLESGVNEFLFDSESYINIASFGGLLYVSAEIDGPRQTYYYIDDFSFLRLESDNADYIKQVDTFDNIDIVQKESGIYLYKDDVFVQKLDDFPSGYEGTRNVYLYNERFYITSIVATDPEDIYSPNVYDLDGNLLSVLTDYELPMYYFYILFSDNYMIETNELVSSSSSVVMDKNGEDVCTSTIPWDLKIISLNQKLYGVLDGNLYEIEELHYSVPLRYNRIQQGFIFWASIVVLAGFSVKRNFLFD